MTINREDIALWADGTWCFQEEIEDYKQFMSDDFSIIPFESKEWDVLTENNGTSVTEKLESPADIYNSRICDICGEYSVNLVGGICDTPSCIRYREKP